MPSKIHYKSNSHKSRIILSRGSLAREVGRGLTITFFPGSSGREGSFILINLLVTMHSIRAKIVISTVSRGTKWGLASFRSTTSTTLLVASPFPSIIGASYAFSIDKSPRSPRFSSSKSSLRKPKDRSKKFF